MGLFNIIKTNNTTSKNFSYSKGKISLNFSLRTDIKQEMKDFLELLKVAQKEVELELNPEQPIKGSGFGEGCCGSG